MVVNFFKSLTASHLLPSLSVDSNNNYNSDNLEEIQVSKIAKMFQQEEETISVKPMRKMSASIPSQNNSVNNIVSKINALSAYAV